MPAFLYQWPLWVGLTLIVVGLIVVAQVALFLVRRFLPARMKFGHDESHYGTAILPTRARKPRDKAKVEVGVQVVQRWVLARLRNRVFHTLAALNEAIRECVDDLNRRRMRDYGKSRLEMFESIERSELRPLPNDRLALQPRPGGDPQQLDPAVLDSLDVVLGHPDLGQPEQPRESLALLGDR